jgi:hypothetical protein
VPLQGLHLDLRPDGRTFTTHRSRSRDGVGALPDVRQWRRQHHSSEPPSYRGRTPAQVEHHATGAAMKSDHDIVGTTFDRGGSEAKRKLLIKEGYLKK